MTSPKKFSVYSSRTLVLLFVVTFAMSLGMNSMSPIWPLYIKSLGAAMIEVTTVISLSGIVGTVLRAPSGVVSDKVGRRRMILASIILATIPPLFYMQATIWYNLIPWAIMYGSAFAFLMPTLMAWIADLVKPEERARAYSFLNAAFPIGSVLGPTLGGMVVDSLSWRHLFMFAAMIHALCLLPFMLIRDSGKAVVEPGERSTRASFTEVQLRALLLLITLQFLQGLGFGLITPMIPFHLTEAFGSTATQVGLFSSIGFGVTAVLAQIPSARLSELIGEERLVFYCSSVIPLAVFLWPSRAGYLEALLLYMIATAAWSMTWSPLVSILMETSPASRRGLFSGIMDASVMLGFTVGPAAGGMLWDSMGYQAPFSASALVLGISVPLALLLDKSQRTPLGFHDAGS